MIWAAETKCNQIVTENPKSQLQNYANPMTKISRLIKDGTYIPINRGLYVKEKNIPEYVLVGVIYGPSYLSFDFVLAWYGLIPETVQTFTSVTLNIYYPESGTVVNPRPAMILKTAPNMDNAKAFVDFLFSDEAQKMVADAYLLPGRRFSYLYFLPA